MIQRKKYRRALRRWGGLCAGLLLLCGPAFAANFEEAELELTRLPGAGDTRAANGGIGGGALPGQVQVENVQGGTERELLILRGEQLLVCELTRVKSAPVWRLVRALDFRGGQDAGLRPIYYSLANLGSAVRQIVFADPGGIWYYPLEDGKLAAAPQRLLDLSFPSAGNSPLRLADFTIDVDRDGQDELLVPALDRVQLWRRTGENWDAIELPGIQSSEFSTFGITGTRSDRSAGPLTLDFATVKSPPRFYFADANQDAKLDLIRIDQAPKGMRMSGVAGNAELQARENEPLVFQIYPYRDGQFTTQPLHSITSHQSFGAQYFFADFDGDGLPDRAECRSTGDPVAPTARFELFLARGGSAGQTPDQPDLTYRSKDPLGFHFFNDLNRDGKLDIYQCQFDYSITSSTDMAGIILGREFRLDLECYLSSAAGWPARPNFRKRIELRGTQLRFYIDLNNDFDGDGIPDLALQDRAEKLTIYLYDPQLPGWKVKPETRLNLGENFSLYIGDVNGDGRADVLNCLMEEGKIETWLSKR